MQNFHTFRYSMRAYIFNVTKPPILKPCLSSSKFELKHMENVRNSQPQIPLWLMLLCNQRNIVKKISLSRLKPVSAQSQFGHQLNVLDRSQELPSITSLLVLLHFKASICTLHSPSQPLQIFMILDPINKIVLPISTNIGVTSPRIKQVFNLVETWLRYGL